MTTAHAVKAAGATILRGGRSSADVALRISRAGRKGAEAVGEGAEGTGLPVITELLSEAHARWWGIHGHHSDRGAESQNFQLLIAAAKTGKPILLKRGLSMKIEEWCWRGICLAHENPNLMFCERGIRTFETYTRNTLDLTTIPIIKKESHCPIVIDPSQRRGGRIWLPQCAREPVAMGADALLIECTRIRRRRGATGHSRCPLEIFAKLMQELRP